MPTPPVIDVDRLLAPISASAPTGSDIRTDFSPQSSYFALKDAQARARTDERRRRTEYEDQPDTGFRPEDWDPVIEHGELILTEKSKDLEVATWYLEALLRQQGFAGVRDGLRLIRELVEHFWDGIFPQPDEDGLATTVSALGALNGVDGPGTLIWPISNIPITEGQSWGAWQYRQAQTLDGAADDEKQKRVAEGGVTLEMFEEAVTSSPTRFYVDMLQDLQQAQQELQKLTALLDEKCGTDSSGYPIAPSTTSINDALSEALQILKSATSGLVLETESPTDAATSAGGAVGASTRAGSGGGIMVDHATMSREQAFKSILQLAEFFKKTEPHSPVAYLLEKSVRGGKMPLPRLLRELIKDDPMLSELFRVMGVSEGSDGSE
jgi:type VI secretion system protein ImpA